MSLEMIEGFDHYQNGTMLQRKWDTTSGTVGGAFGPGQTAPGRFGGNSWNFGTGTSIASIVLTSNQLAAVATRGIGFALNPGNTWITGGRSFLQINDGSTEQVSLHPAGSGMQISIQRGSTVLATTTNALVYNTWHYIELKITINATTGAFSLYVTQGGARSLWASGSGVNTQSTANASTNGLWFANDNNATFSLDDVYILNTSGSVNNDLLGECRVITSLPNADSAAPSTNSLWTPNSGTVHNTRVNEASIDDDTSYVSSATAGQIDTYKFATVTPTGAVAGMQTVLTARKDDVGSRTICSEYRGGGTNYDGANNFSPGSGYLMFRQIYEVDPATGLAWNATGINNGEYGVKCIA